jgi:hypothetical protein
MVIRIRLVGFELVKKGGEPLAIVSNSGGLADVKHLPD